MSSVGCTLSTPLLAPRASSLPGRPLARWDIPPGWRPPPYQPPVPNSISLTAHMITLKGPSVLLSLGTLALSSDSPECPGQRVSSQVLAQSRDLVGRCLCAQGAPGEKPGANLPCPAPLHTRRDRANAAQGSGQRDWADGLSWLLIAGGGEGRSGAVAGEEKEENPPAEPLPHRLL